MASTPNTPLSAHPNAPSASSRFYSPQYSFRAQKSLGIIASSTTQNPTSGKDQINFKPLSGLQGQASDAAAGTGNVQGARIFVYSGDGRFCAYAIAPSSNTGEKGGVKVFELAEYSASSSTDLEGAKLLCTLPLPTVYELRFSPKGTYLSTWERPAKMEDGSQHKNLRIWKVPSSEDEEPVEVISFTQKGGEHWDVQYTSSESHAVRLVGPEIQVFHPTDWSKGIVDKMKVEGAAMISLSPGLNPGVAVFCPEKKGAPASFRVYSLISLAGSPSTPPTAIAQKTFYKADRCTVKWNAIGTQVLLLTQTEVDQANKNYYGETMMYLLSTVGNGVGYEGRVQLDREGPIYDFCWNPSGKEFGVVYGYMPAKATLFDQRSRPVHDFGSSPSNFILFSPTGRLIALAGFGNLAGLMNVYDRKSLQKVATISAPNTSHCEWSPCGRYLLTAILSPRLRVDNGVKVWWCKGQPGDGEGELVHWRDIDECYAVGWRPCPANKVPQFPHQIPSAPEPSEEIRLQAGGALGNGISLDPLNGDGTPGSGAATPVKKPVPVKAMGAYRPPGARGLATPTIFLREDEGGMARLPTGSGANTPNRNFSRSPVPGDGHYHSREGGGHGRGGGGGGSYGPGLANGRRYVPGAPPPRDQAGAQNAGDGAEKKRKRNKAKKKGGADGEGGEGEDVPGSPPPGPASPTPNGEKKKNKKANKKGPAANGKDPSGPAANGEDDAALTPTNGSTPGVLNISIDTAVETIAKLNINTSPSDLGPVTPGLESALGLDPIQKKARNLNKKLKAIDELKEKQKRGERLEATQLKKIETEGEIRKELAGLGVV